MDPINIGILVISPITLIALWEGADAPSGQLTFIHFATGMVAAVANVAFFVYALIHTIGAVT